MKYLTILLVLAVAVSVMSKPAVDNGEFHWDLPACEQVAAKAREESKVCKDYVCKEYSYGLTVTGVDCQTHH